MRNNNPAKTSMKGDTQQSDSPFWQIPAFLIRRLQLISTAIVAEAVADANLTMPQWAVLAHIDETPDVDQSRLAEMTSFDKTSTGRIVDQLEATGLVERRPNGTDRRAWMLRATARAHQLRRKLRPRALASQERFLSCLTAKEQETFVALLRRVVVANERYIRPGAGRRNASSRRKAAEPSDVV
jgi:DNA-binding MarR family transcriptional regulator